MEEAGKREKELAIERGDYHEDIPAITVITNGGWSKKLHCHSYNAKSSVGVIIRLETRKILHLSVYATSTLLHVLQGLLESNIFVIRIGKVHHLPWRHLQSWKVFKWQRKSTASHIHVLSEMEVFQCIPPCCKKYQCMEDQSTKWIVLTTRANAIAQIYRT